MPEIKDGLKIGDLVLDHDNPRISHAAGQQEALQKIVNDQRTKLVKLAQSIVEHGLNPMDRFLVLRLNQTPTRYIALEGNRRIAIFKMLANPAVMTGLDMPAPMRTILENLAKTFKKNRVEPLSCFELSSRDEARYWLGLRHNIGHDGAGVDNWKTLAKRRFEGKPPSVQVLELVTEQAGLTQSERAAITDKFPVSTLERIIENRTVQKELGIAIKDDKVVTRLPAAEVAKSLKRIVTDLATKRVKVNKLMKTEDMLKYVREDLGNSYLPDMSKARSSERSLDEIPSSEFAKLRTSPAPRRKPDPSDRRVVVPNTCRLNVRDNRIADIYKELRTIRLEDARNAIAVLLRVFLEMSVDHFLENNGGTLKFTPPGAPRERFKSLDKKLAEVVVMLVSMKVPEEHFTSVTRDLSQEKSPMNLDLWHRYVHDRFATPSISDLTAAWDHAQPLFEKIWP
jgi:hypothetical protein